MKENGMHYEYAIEANMRDITGNPEWWVATDWYRHPDNAKRDWEKLMLRNRNEEIDPPILAHRMVRRAVGKMEVVRPDAEAGGDDAVRDEIVVLPSPSADTRSADHIITEDELARSTELHIGDVKRGMDWMARRIQEIGARHDWTKVEFLQDFYRQFRKAQETGEWGVGWYDEIHIAKERHHLEDRCPDDVTLLDVLERIVDGVMAGKARNGRYVPRPLDAAILERAYMNTQDMLEKVVRVAAPDAQVAEGGGAGE